MKLYRKEMPFQITNSAFLIILSLTMIAPLIHLLAISLSSALYANAKLVYLWPKDFNVRTYAQIIGYEHLWRAMGVTIYITVMGTILCLVLSSSIAYAISRPNMVGRKYVTQGILVTFVFSAPLIPAYLVVRNLGLENKLWALIIPNALGAYYVLIMKTFFQGISSELYDAAKIDGCNEFGIYFRIVVPLSKAVMATIALFHAVGQWNSYFNALIFIRDKKLHPLQIVLRNLIIDDVFSEMMAGNIDLQTLSSPEQMRAAIIIFATIPILLVYPFLQKYFVKGAMLGSVKG
jgi:putative aldouronate transport system permease protein